MALLSKRLISLPIHQRIQLLNILQLDLSQPALALRSFVDQTRLLLQHAVRLGDYAADGRHDVAGGLDALDCADAVAGVDFEVGSGEFDEDDVAESVGCVGGYADCTCVWVWVSRCLFKRVGWWGR